MFIRQKGRQVKFLNLVFTNTLLRRRIYHSSSKLFSLKYSPCSLLNKDLLTMVTLQTALCFVSISIDFSQAIKHVFMKYKYLTG